MILLLGGVILIGNKFYFQEQEPYNGDSKYVPGVILVGFIEDITEEEANALVQSYGLSWESRFSKSVGAWIKVTKGSPEDYEDSLEANDLIYWADPFRKPFEYDYNTKYILIRSNKGVTEKDIRELIDSFENLDILYFGDEPRWGEVNVPEGGEEKWIKILKQEKIIKYAELNHYVYLS